MVDSRHLCGKATSVTFNLLIPVTVPVMQCKSPNEFWCNMKLPFKMQNVRHFSVLFVLPVQSNDTFVAESQ